jgi:hypothetical protein
MRACLIMTGVRFSQAAAAEGRDDSYCCRGTVYAHRATSTWRSSRAYGGCRVSYLNHRRFSRPAEAAGAAP